MMANPNKESVEDGSINVGSKIDMSNSLKQGTISIVVFGKDGNYTAICREFGFVEQGTNAEEVRRRMINSCILLLKTVKENPRLEPSLNIAPPLKYLLLYYWVISFATIAKMFYDFMSITTESRSHLVHA